MAVIVAERIKNQLYAQIFRKVTVHIAGKVSLRN